MPGEKHYFDAPNDADFLEKFVQHHADPAKRHISQYEANRIRKITEDFLSLLQKTKTDPSRLDTYSHHESKFTRTFSMNERGKKVSHDLAEVFTDSEDLKIITGYSSMKEVLKVVRKYPESRIQIIFGNEPSPSSIKSSNNSPRNLTKEMVDYWLARGISILDVDIVFDALQALEEGRIEVKIGCKKERLLHAKVYIGKLEAIIGSSNFSDGGLRTNREFNARFHISEGQRFRKINDFWNLTWGEGADFSEEFAELLLSMLRKSPWREALAKAIALLLESGWMDSKLGIDEAQLEKSLLPHQIDGLKRALWILENKGAVLVADATGSGKTKLGTWLCKTAWVRKFQQSSNINMIPPTIHMPPNVEKSWDFETQMANYLPRLLPESYLSGSKKVSNQEEVEWGRKQSPIIMYDEAHHFYSTANRGKAARDHYADSVILLTATPISKGVNDAESCIRLLGTENVDPDVIEGIRDLKKELKIGTKEERKAKIAKAGSYLQSFTIRRTRNEINDFSDQFPEKYTLDGRRLRYPDSEAVFYHMHESAEDEKELKAIEDNLQQIRGLARIASIIERTDKEIDDKDTTILKRRVGSSKGLTMYHFWDSLIASRASAVEHINGTESARKLFDITTDIRSPLQGVIAKLESMERPKIDLSISDEDIEKMGYDFLLSDEKWKDAVLDELDTWGAISHHVNRISDRRDSMKVKQLVDLYKMNKRILAFSQDIISLHYFMGKLNGKGVKIASKNGKELVFDSSVDKSDAENLFGLDTDFNEPLIGLFSNRFSEGVNLQSASTLVHLDTPTTVTVAEQRCGRVDRFNALHSNIEFYWPKDYGILGKVTSNKLRERNEFVGNTIGAQMILPDDENYRKDELDDEVYENIEHFAEALNLQNRVEINAIDDAFSGVRLLKEELISDEIYDIVKDSDVKINSRVSVLQSRSPWCFCALGSDGKGEKPPQWVLIRFDMSTTTPKVKMTTDLSEISEFLLEELPLCEDVGDIDQERYPKWRNIFVKSLKERTIQLVSPKQRALLNQAKDAVESWRKKPTWDGQNKWINDFKLMLTRGFFNGIDYDLRDVSDWWFQETKVLQQKINSTKSRRKSRQKLMTDKQLIRNLKNNEIPFEDFLTKFDQVKTSQPLDSRMISVIFAWPQGLNAPSRVQAFNPK